MHCVTLFTSLYHYACVPSLLNRYDAHIRHALTAEMSETFPSGGSIHASVKLEGIDGRAPQERVDHVA